MSLMTDKNFLGTNKTLRLTRSEVPRAIVRRRVKATKCNKYLSSKKPETDVDGTAGQPYDITQPGLPTLVTSQFIHTKLNEEKL